MARVELEKVFKRYGSFETVHGIDLAITDNEFVVLVGPSGCGKSTILRMIAGLEEISDGTMRIGDRVVNDIDPKSRNVAMVFQNYALYPHKNVFDNMGFSLKMAGLSRDEIKEKVEQAAKVLELTPYLDRKPAALSGGQRQRVAMGRAIVRDPDVFLFDEPLSNLDAQLRTQMRMELKKLHMKMKTTTIYVTHDQVEAMTLADRIVVIKDGTIHQVGTPIEVFEKPKTVFVAKFIGNPPTNIVAGQVIEQNGAKGVDCENGMFLPFPHKTALEIGRNVLAGIRPDAIVAEEAVNRFAPSWQYDAHVLFSEIVGGQSLLEFDINGISMVAELDGRHKVDPGTTLKLGFDLDRLFIFDPETNLALDW